MVLDEAWTHPQFWRIFHYLLPHQKIDRNMWKRQQTCFGISCLTTTKNVYYARTMARPGNMMLLSIKEYTKPNYLLWLFLTDTTILLSLKPSTITKRGAVIHLALRRLQELYPTFVKASMDDIFVWLYHKHGPWLIDQGFEVDFIERRLNTTLPVAMTTTQEVGLQ